MNHDFPFDDLHGFKDYITFVQLCCPDDFPLREGRPPNRQWSLDLAFEGLRVGIMLAIQEKGNHPIFLQCLDLIEESFQLYQQQNISKGFAILENVRKLLQKIPSK